MTGVPAMPHQFIPVNPATSGRHSSNILQGVKIGKFCYQVFIVFPFSFSEVEARIFGSGFRSCGLFGVDLLAIGSEKETSLATLHLGLTTGRWFEDFHGSKAWVQKSC